MVINKTNVEVHLKDGYKNIKAAIVPRDGLNHCLILNDAITTKGALSSYCDIEYTRYLDNIIVNLQKDGYEVIDMKTQNFLQNFSQYLILYTTIIYK